MKRAPIEIGILSFYSIHLVIQDFYAILALKRLAHPIFLEPLRQHQSSLDTKVCSYQCNLAF
jgi:hypothetical protein